MKRDPYFDVLKFLAMFLVVLGHTYWAMDCKTGMPYFENFRCGMNMPLFFMISGYFSARMIVVGDWKTLGRHLVGYFWPMVVFSCIFSVLTVTLSLPGSEKGLIGYAGRRVLFATWFLWCLAICLVATFICQRPGRAWQRALTWSGMICAIFLLARIFGLHNVRAMLPHYLFGVFVLRRWELWKHFRIGLPCLIIFTLLVFIQGDILSNGLSFYKNDVSFASVLENFKSLVFYILRIVNGLIGSLGVMWLLYVVMGRVKYFDTLAPLGTTTLGVYILHQWLLAQISLTWGDGFAGALLLAILLFASCHLLVRFTRKVGLLRRYIWGDCGRGGRI